ncbi:MAG: hypothetical protein PVF58_14385 [Candidatus Methanofastidiosia archaeon]|jgi:hypothetical protein
MTSNTLKEIKEAEKWAEDIVKKGGKQIEKLLSELEGSKDATISLLAAEKRLSPPETDENLIIRSTLESIMENIKEANEYPGPEEIERKIPPQMEYNPQQKETHETYEKAENAQDIYESWDAEEIPLKDSSGLTFKIQEVTPLMVQGKTDEYPGVGILAICNGRSIKFKTTSKTLMSKAMNRVTDTIITFTKEESTKNPGQYYYNLTSATSEKKFPYLKSMGWTPENYDERFRF